MKSAFTKSILCLGVALLVGFAPSSSFAEGRKGKKAKRDKQSYEEVTARPYGEHSVAGYQNRSGQGNGAGCAGWSNCGWGGYGYHGGGWGGGTGSVGWSRGGWGGGTPTTGYTPPARR